MHYKYILPLFFVLNAGMVKAQPDRLLSVSAATPHYTQSIIAQSVEASKISYSSYALQQALKAKPQRHGLEKTGRVMTYIGVPLMMIGGGLIYNSQNLYKKARCQGRHGCLFDPQAPIGYTLLATSTAMTFTSVMFWIHGSKKTKRGIL